MDQVPYPPHLAAIMLVRSHGCYKGLVAFALPAGHKSPRVLSASLSVSLFLKRQVSSLGTLPLWVLGSLWGGHRSVGGGSDKL